MGHPNIWGVWMYGAYECMRASKYKGVSIGMENLNVGGIQMYGGYLNIWGPPNKGSIQTYRGIWRYGDVQMYGDIKMYRGSPNIWGHMDTPKSDTPMSASNLCTEYTKLTLFLGGIWMYRGHPKILEASKHMGASECIGDVQTYGWHPCF